MDLEPAKHAIDAIAQGQLRLTVLLLDLVGILEQLDAENTRLRQRVEHLEGQVDHHSDWHERP